MKWNTSWKASIKPRKQRIYRHRAPLHIRQKLVAAHLSKELRAKYKRRSIGLRKGDKVKIMRGQFKGKTGTVENIDLKKLKVAVSDIEIVRKDGKKVFYPLDSSVLMITELNLEDKKRSAKLLQKAK